MHSVIDKVISNKFARMGMAAVALPAVGFIGYLLWAWHHALEPGDDIIVVQPGTSLRAFARGLYEKDILPDPKSLVWLAHLKGQGRDLKVGEYRFESGISASELLEQVVEGRVIEYPLVLIEGWTFKQMRQALARAPKLNQTLAGLSDKEVMGRLNQPRLFPEGRFFPDTYRYPVGTTDLALLKIAFEKMQRRLEREWEGREPGLPLKDADEALVLASIIEKETGLASERPLIAGVFINRLRKNMRLQTDPTVIYGLGERFDGNLRRRDLRNDTPYNTYTRRGLPPTPIAMPSGEAIRAALHPAQTSALYFVSRGDGSHVFSETLEEHNRAVAKYQLGR